MGVCGAAVRQQGSGVTAGGNSPVSAGSAGHSSSLQ